MFKTTLNSHFPYNKHENNCCCGKKYATHSGLWKHKKTCKSQNDTNVENIEQPTNDIIITAKMCYDLMLQNNELSKCILKLMAER